MLLTFRFSKSLVI